MNISFKSGALEISCIDIDKTLEVMIWNLIAFDQYHVRNEMYTIDYVLFLDGLINTEDNTHLLAKVGVIINNFGSNDWDR